MTPGAAIRAGERYRLRTLGSEQRGDWDTFVQQHSQGHLMQSWNWGELKRGAGWQPLRLALWDNEQQHIVAGAQVLRRSGAHIPLRAGHLAYIPKGPLLDWSQAELCQRFFALLNSSLHDQGALALRLEPAVIVESAEGEQVVERLRTLNMHPAKTVQPLRTILLDIEPEEAHLLAQMKEKWRYNIRLAARKGVTIRVAQNPEDVRAWYQLLQTTGERDTFGIHTEEYYQHVWQLFAPQDNLRLLLAEHNGQLLAGIFASLFAREAIYLYGASSNEQRNLMPNYLLQWEAIRWAKQRGAVSYDLWGIPDTEAEDEAMAGVYRFKRGWGGRVVQFLGCYEQTYRPLLMQVASRFM